MEGSCPPSPLVPYERQTIDHPNPLARFAHRSRHHRSLQLADRHLGQGARVLDLGAGTGAFLHRLGEVRSDLDRIAFEPFMTIRYPGIERQRTLGEGAKASIDTICAFEVFEHLAPLVLEETLAGIDRLLKPCGKLIVSVPVMEGLALPAKEASRVLLFRRRSDYGMGELVQGTLGRAVARTTTPLTSHKGFSHRALQRELERRFRLVERVFSPFSALPWWCNSQLFCVFTHH